MSANTIRKTFGNFITRISRNRLKNYPYLQSITITVVCIFKRNCVKKPPSISEHRTENMTIIDMIKWLMNRIIFVSTTPVNSVVVLSIITELTYYTACEDIFCLEINRRISKHCFLAKYGLNKQILCQHRLHIAITYNGNFNAPFCVVLTYMEMSVVSRNKSNCIIK